MQREHTTNLPFPAFALPHLGSTPGESLEAASAVSSIAEADWHFARALGQGRPDRQWILSDRDVWYRNPFYRGPITPHPEECFYDEVEYEAAVFTLNFIGPPKQEAADGWDEWDEEDLPF